MVEHSRTQDCVEGGLSQQNSFGNLPQEGKHTRLYERSFPITPGKGSGPSHSDATFFKPSATSSSLENEKGSGTATKCVHYHFFVSVVACFHQEFFLLLCQNWWHNWSSPAFCLQRVTWKGCPLSLPIGHIYWTTYSCFLTKQSHFSDSNSKCEP